MARDIDTVLIRLRDLIEEGRYEALESATLEIKPLPATGNEWDSIAQSVAAFLNTRGGNVLVGFRESTKGEKRWSFTPWDANSENKVKQLAARFTDRRGKPVSVEEHLRHELLPFPGGQVLLIEVSELPADTKYILCDNVGYKRILTGDHKITEAELDEQENFAHEAALARELDLVDRAVAQDLSIERLNEYIQQLNAGTRIESLKPDLESARSFLERKQFLRNGKPTILGMLVCGTHPEDFLGFRAQVHGHVEAPHEIARDKQDFVGNVLPLMEQSLRYVLRNIRVGISPAGGGTAVPEYPENLLRETINNALAHRDYRIDGQVIISIRPDTYLQISNPGRFRPSLLIEFDPPGEPIPVRRIIPDAKPANPKLADVLRVYRRWEGKGIGMATLVELCLKGEIGLPVFRLGMEKIVLELRPRPLIDEFIDLRLEACDAYIKERLGTSLTDEQKAVLGYLIKSERENRRFFHTILLTADNNHSEALLALQHSGMIEEHPRVRNGAHKVFVVDRAIMEDRFQSDLLKLFGDQFKMLDEMHQRALGVVCRYGRYSSYAGASAKQVARTLWAEDRRRESIDEFDRFYRKIRRAFNQLATAGFVRPIHGARSHARWQLNADFGNAQLLTPPPSSAT